MLCTITWPTTNLPRAPGPRTDEGSIPFYICDEDNTPEHGHGGHGHGCSAGQPASETSSKDCMHVQEEADNNTQFLVNNLEWSKTTYMDFLYDMYSELYAVDIDTLQANVVTFQLNESTLLLDSCSTSTCWQTVLW